MKKILLLLYFTILCLTLAACGNPKTTNSAEGYIGTNYETVVTELKEAGFTNIELQEIQDMTSANNLPDGYVGAISINGETDFADNVAYKSDVPIVITYHTVKKLNAPISSNDIQEYDSSTIATLFTNTGFKNVSIEEVYDLDPDIHDVEFQNEVSINYSSSFNKDDPIPFDAKISVICHRPYEKYSVKISVDFIPNLIFSKYDVTLSLDNQSYTLEHGKDGEFEFSLKEGIYTLSFFNKDSSSVKGEIEIDVKSNIEAAFKISCYNDKVSVDTIYIDTLEILAADEVKVMCAYSSFAYENYIDVVNTLKQWGFTNIAEVPIYDIYWGITEEGSVANVTINGFDNYTRGSIFKKDVEVVVSYHMNEEDDPNRSETSTTPDSWPDIPSENEESSIIPLTVDNCPELASILSIQSEYDESYVSFASKYQSRIIEFDGRIDYIADNGTNTRYDILVSAGNYDPNHQIGPIFKFENVGAYDLGLGSLDIIPYELPIGSNVRIVAKVISYNSNSFLFFLDPISVKLR